MSPSLRWWSSWWWPLHLCPFRCRLLDDSHYTCTLHRVQIKSIQTTPKPLQTLAFVGVSQTHDGSKKTADTAATATTATPRDARRTATTGTARPRRAYDMHDGHGHDVSTALIRSRPRNITRHAKTQSHRRTNVAPCNKHPRGEPPARPFCWGRWDNSRNSARVFEKFAHKT